MNKNTAHITTAKPSPLWFQVTSLTQEKLYRTWLCKIIWVHSPLPCHCSWAAQGHVASLNGSPAPWWVCERQNLRKLLKAVKSFN